MPGAKESLEVKYTYELGFTAMFGFTPAVSNYYVRRPLHSGIHRHIFLGICGWIVGHYTNRFLENRWIERDAIIKHYVELHPEDFKDERKKYKEMFDEWYPQR